MPNLDPLIAAIERRKKQRPQLFGTPESVTVQTSGVQQIGNTRTSSDPSAPLNGTRVLNVIAAALGGNARINQEN